MNARDHWGFGRSQLLTEPSMPAPVIGSALLLALASTVLFGLLAEDVRNHEALPLDSSAGQFLHSYSSPQLDAAMQALSFIGSGRFVIPCLVVVVLWMVRSRRLAEAVFLPGAYAGSAALNYLLKLAFHRARPELPWSAAAQDFSFPSGHAMNSSVFYLGLTLLVWTVLGRRVGLLGLSVALLVVLLVGVSRVYLGYHYVSDVIGGYSAGLLWLILWTLAQRFIWKRARSRLDRSVAA